MATTTPGISNRHPGAPGGLVDYYLKIDTIQGESPDEKHKNEIEIESWTFGEEQTGTFAHGGGGGAGRVQLKDFRFAKRLDKASPKLMLACANGEHIKTCVLTARKAGKQQQEFLKITFTDVLVSSYHTIGSGDGDIVPRDEITFNFAKIEMEYKEQKADGTLAGVVKAGWDAKQNKAA